MQMVVKELPHHCSWNLDKNNALFLDGEKRLSDGTLVAITLMIAESKPEEKEVMVKLVMNLLKL